MKAATNRPFTPEEKEERFFPASCKQTVDKPNREQNKEGIDGSVESRTKNKMNKIS